MPKILTFSKGGIHPKDKKELAKHKPISDAPKPDIVHVAIRQHIGAPSKPIVKPKQEVKKGELVAEPGGFVSAAQHSPVSGTVKFVKDVPHLMGGTVKAVQIENDGKEEWADGCNVETDWQSFSADELKEKIKNAGIVGMGGATFPTHVKLSPPPDKKIDTVILNGIECEPYLTCDHRLMLEDPDRVLQGLLICKKILGAEKAYVSIEANKMDAYMLMKEKAAAYDGLQVTLHKVHYPQGAEKQLIESINGREVPSGGLPMDVGCVVQNVATAAAIFDACAKNIPLIERIMTVSGDGVKETANVRIKVGQMLKPILDHCGMSEKTKKLVFGGPMTGFAQPDAELPLSKGSSGVLALIKGVRKYEPRMCIRCARCVDHCPVGLMPSMLSLLEEAGRLDEMEHYNALDCIECGVCTYICPSRRPMVQQIKLGKQHIMAKRKKK
ncbi:MAG: electron transport complex subunit RsxC [Planctomycetota bacterium]|nr:electron transport complex subunit RsxC [Planctomycetota bacterium]